ncbi:MAG: hypothetical protein K2L11_00960 [Muribaculaceae bacterium]|nr:hypothetical protein [Muribaculaceae bacterium]
MKYVRVTSAISLVFAIGISTNSLYAQNTYFDKYVDNAWKDFGHYVKTSRKEFEEYRNRVNQEFAEFMRGKWDRHEAEDPVPAPPLPEPPEPTVANPEDEPSNDKLPFAEIIPVPDVPAPPVALLPSFDGEEPELKVTPTLPSDPIAIRPPKHPGKEIAFNYYGSLCRIPFNKPVRVTLNGADENSVADAWNRLTSEETVDLVRHCVDLRDRLCLPDWGYLRLVENLSNTLCPGDRNAATLLQMFLLTQSGYKVRIGRRDDRLLLLIPSSENIYNFSYIPNGNLRYYIIDRDGKQGPIHLLDREFPREQFFSLALSRQPKLPINEEPSRHFTIERPAKIDVEVTVNSNLINFYNDYPLSSHWNIYSNASLSEEVREQLFPELRMSIEGKSEREAANILLHFVQKAFKYMTDGDQFGYERPFFPDETFHYPYSDCEDRAILYSVLVRELLGLDTVLVAYPNHLATAVRFDGEVAGDYFVIDGKNYTVCDPTYINADVGMAMRQYKNASAEIIRL